MISRDQTVKLQRKIADIQNIAQLQKELVGLAPLSFVPRQTSERVGLSLGRSSWPPSTPWT